MTLEELLASLKNRVATFHDGRKGIRVEGAFEVKAVDGEANVIEMIGSDETVDRYGEVVSVDGWQLDNYRKNPVVLLGHNYDQVVARSQEVGVREVSGKKRLVFRIEFPTKDIHEAGWQVGQLYRHGYMKASSVGFIPLDWEFAPADDQTKGEDAPPRLIFKKQELLELSLVAVPANPSAVMLALSEARKKGSLSEAGMLAVQKSLGLEKAEEPAAPPAPAPAPAEGDPQAKMIEAVKGVMGEVVKAELAPHLLALSEIKTMLQELLLTTDPKEPDESSKGAKPQADSTTGLYDGILSKMKDLKRGVSEAKNQIEKGGKT